MVTKFANGDRLFTNGGPLGYSINELVWSWSLMEWPRLAFANGAPINEQPLSGISVLH